MVYLPTFGYNFVANVGKYTMHRSFGYCQHHEIGKPLP